MADEYVRKQDAVERMADVIINEFDVGITYAYTLAEDGLNLPPADVVPVVRCENCVHWSDSNQCERPELAGNRWHDDKYFETLPDDFCSYGERRSEQDGRSKS